MKPATSNAAMANHRPASGVSSFVAFILGFLICDKFDLALRQTMSKRQRLPHQKGPRITMRGPNLVQYQIVLANDLNDCTGFSVDQNWQVVHVQVTVL